MKLGNINIVNDIGAPAMVTFVNVFARASTKEIGGMSVADAAVYAMTAGGYLGAWMGWGGPFVKNIAIAAAPLAFEKLYDSFLAKPAAARVSRVSYPAMRVSRYPGSASESPFEGVKLV